MPRPRQTQDHWFREAKRHGWRSRAAYKLLQLDEKFSLLRDGDCVLDLGAAPGSWLQVAAKKVGDKGHVVGIDLTPIDGPFDPDVVTTIHGDATAIDPGELAACIPGGVAKAFDLVLSDMAPSTTGDRSIDHHGSVNLCHMALEIAATSLKQGGHIVMKVLEGEAYSDLMERTKSMFAAARGFKPKASRSVSTEMFIIGLDRRPNLPPAAHCHPPTSPTPPPPPAPGWSS